MYRFKLFLKSHIPKSLFNISKSIFTIFEMLGIFVFETKDLLKVSYSSSYDKLKYNFLLNSHILEKGLGHENFRPRFGKTILKELSMNIDEWNKQHYPKDNKVYQIGLSTLNFYYVKHQSIKEDCVDILNEFFDKEIVEEIISSNTNLGGTKIVKKETALSYKNFEELANNRFSYRNFKTSFIDIKKIEDAIDIAKKSPSSCNRQSIRARILTDKDAIESVLQLHKGLKDTPPALIMITADEECYPNGQSRNLGFVDGGIFIMSLCYALHEKKIANAILNGALTRTTAKSIKKIFDAKELEKIVGFIVAGDMEEEMLVGKSTRVPIEDTIRIL